MRRGDAATCAAAERGIDASGAWDHAAQRCLLAAEQYAGAHKQRIQCGAAGSGAHEADGLVRSLYEVCART